MNYLEAKRRNCKCEISLYFHFFSSDNEVMFSNSPGDIKVNNDAGQSFAIVTWTAPTVTDNFGSYTVTSSHSSGSSFSIGITRVTYSVVDASGNTASYSFNITVIGKFIVSMQYPNMSPFLHWS